MTAQYPEGLIYQGEEMDMYTEPLSDYLNKSAVKIRFRANCSALWRGYIGSWEVLEGQLLLTSLKGTLEDGTEASLSTIFPDALGKVPARWYSGTLQIPKGRELKYIHMGYGSIFEYDLFLEVLRGRVIATRLHRNEVEEGLNDYEIPF